MIEIDDTPTMITVFHGEDMASLYLMPHEDGFICGGLVSTGKASCLIALFRRLVSRKVPIWGMPDESTTVYDQMISMYERFKFVRIGSIAEGPDGEVFTNDHAPSNFKRPVYRLN